MKKLWQKFWKKQANDENVVDADGNLVEKKTAGAVANPERISLRSICQSKD